MVKEVKHTDAIEQAKFLALSPEQQALMIWLNGNETNGAVADALRDIAALALNIQKHDARLTALEHWQIKAASVIGASIIAAPFFFYGLTKALGG